MRWNCPHCGTNLAIADEKMSASWSFSRCYQCAGYALVRQSEVNIIKVDRAPAGEKVILPESSETPVMNETATRNLSRFTGATASAGAASAMAASGDKSVVKPVTRRNTSPGMTNPLGAGAPGSMMTHTAYDPAQHKLESTGAFAAPSQPFAPASTAAAKRPLAGPNAPAGATADRSALTYLNGVNNVGAFPEPLPEVPIAAARIRLLPMAIGIAAAFALGSGLYLLAQSGTLFEKTRASNGARPSRAPATDLMPEAAKVAVNEAAKEEVTVREKVVAKAEPSAAAYSDQVRSRAMAPDRQQQAVQLAPTAPHPVQLSAENPPLIVQPKTKNIHLRSGPGMVYPVVGNANEKSRYVVTDWSDRWFKVLPQVPDESKQAEEVAGWIRTDSVQVIPSSNSPSS